MVRMAILKLTQVIDRPAERVFATIVDAGHFVDWNPTIKGSRQLTSGPPGEGSRFEWDLAGLARSSRSCRSLSQTGASALSRTSGRWPAAIGSHSRLMALGRESITSWR